MKRIDAWHATGRFVGFTSDEVASRLDSDAACPPTDEYCDLYDCHDCWRNWLEEEVTLQ